MKYVAVPPAVAKELGLFPPFRRTLFDGRVLLNEQDLSGVGTPRQKLKTKVKNLGGELLSTADARKLLKI
jgi:hypothetical protein